MAAASGIAIIPKSATEKRIQESRDVFEFALTDDEMEVIDGLGNGGRVGPHPGHRDF
jgi:diketogulonate reductase-like aldo/keto reductase